MSLKSKNTIESSTLQRILKSENDSTISFALGKPDNTSLPYKAIEDALKSTRNFPKTLQYSPPSAELKNKIVSLVKKRGIICSEDEVFLTSGAQQALNLLAELFCIKNGSVLTDELTYPGFKQIISRLKIPQVVFSTQKEELCYQSKNSTAKEPPNFSTAYVTPTGSNPHGSSMSALQKEQIIGIAKQNNALIFEDDAYGFITNNGTEADNLPIRSHIEKNIFYVGTFSKIICPSFRIGWIVAPKQYHSLFSEFKESYDLNISSFSQHILLNTLETLDIDQHLTSIKNLYEHKRAIMLNALKKHMPNDVKFNKPTAGFFVWVTLPPAINAENLLHCLFKKHNVTFIPGNAFSLEPKYRPSLRLSYSYCEIDRIENGIIKLASLISEHKNELITEKPMGF